MNRSRFFCSVSTLAAVMALGAVGQAGAQTNEPTAGANQVDEIIVTAQRREQSLQDVPIVVTSVSGQLLQDAGVRDIKDLTVLTPGMMVTSTSNETVTSARIRGVGTVGDNPGLESSVGILIDGVYRPRNGVGFGDLGETQRIEVLKGPQGTLFGKNTSSGVINILTKPPEFQFGATSEATMGNYDQMGFSSSITGPITDTLAARLYGALRERNGFQEIYTGGGNRPKEDANQDFFTLRGQLLYKPGDDLSVRIIGDYTERDEDCCVGVQRVNGPFTPLINGLAAATGAGVGMLSPPDLYQRLGFSNRGSEQKVKDQGLSAEVNWGTPWSGATLTSVTSVRKWETRNGQDTDFTALDILYRTPDGFYRTFDQFSQELRLAGETERASWLVGGFYAREALKSGEQFRNGTAMELYLDRLYRAASAPGTPVAVNGLAAITGRPFGTNVRAGQVAQDDRYSQVSKSYAVFGNLSYKLTEALELTAGLRFTSEDKDLDSYYRNGDGGSGGGVGTNPCTLLAINTSAVLGGSLAAPNATLARLYAGYYCRPGADPAYNNLVTAQERSEEEFSGTVKLAYRFNPDFMTYGSYARGYKGGGFNLDRVRIFTNPANPSGVGTPNLDTSFAGEFVDSFELGAKTSWFGRSVLLNAAIFHQTFENYQLNAFDGIAFTVTSIPKVVSRGIDLDMIWSTPVDGLSVQGGVTYAETQYADARPTSPNFALPTAANPAGGGLYRLPGARISFAPLWSASLSTSYERPVGPLMFRANVTAKYTSQYNTGSDLLAQKGQKEMAIFNARMGLSSADERWTVELWGQNLGDEVYNQVSYDGPLQPSQVNTFLGAPRTYGATLRFTY